MHRVGKPSEHFKVIFASFCDEFVDSLQIDNQGGEWKRYRRGMRDDLAKHQAKFLFGGLAYRSFGERLGIGDFAPVDAEVVSIVRYNGLIRNARDTGDRFCVAQRDAIEEAGQNSA